MTVPTEHRPPLWFAGAAVLLLVAAIAGAPFGGFLVVTAASLYALALWLLLVILLVHAWLAMESARSRLLHAIGRRLSDVLPVVVRVAGRLYDRLEGLRRHRHA